MISKERGVLLCVILYILSIFSIFIFTNAASRFYPSMIERKIFMTLAYAPSGLTGIVLFLKPNLALDTFDVFKTTNKKSSLKTFRMNGLMFILMSAFSIIKAWNII